MQKFNVGDKVRVISKSVPGWTHNNYLIGKEGYVKTICGDGSGRDYDNCLIVCKKQCETGYFFAPHDLTLIEPVSKLHSNSLTCNEGSSAITLSSANMEQVFKSAYNRLQDFPIYAYNPGIFDHLIAAVNNKADEVTGSDHKQTITMKLTNAFKKFLNADLQAQVKAGFRDEALNLTCNGKDALLEILATAPASSDYATMFTAAANEIVAEQEKTK